MHNWPGLPAGQFALRPGPVMAAADEFNIRIRGAGGHAAQPHMSRDPIVAGAQIVTALQSIVARKVNPLKPAVVSITKFQAGTANNIIPDEALIAGTCRSFHDEITKLLQDEMTRICEDVAKAMDVEITWEGDRTPYPATVNDPDLTAFSAAVLDDLVGAENVIKDRDPTMGGEDFAFMAQVKPGSFVFIGNGEDSGALHTSTYDFNDDVAPYGTAYWSKLVEAALPAN